MKWKRLFSGLTPLLTPLLAITGRSYRLKDQTQTKPEKDKSNQKGADESAQA